ncbi:MAG: peptidoglycan editing factor PgeF [Acutalibacteraceae bacterium]|jgi:YfiH family protein
MKSNRLKIVRQGQLCYIQFPKLLACEQVRHLFSTRHGGVSTGDCATMNLGFNKDTSRENVLENFRILCSAIGTDPKNLVLSRQTHTDNVVIVNESHRGTGIYKPSFSDVDGLITNCRNVALVTQYADCTPLVFCDPVEGVIATSHAGWRGTVKRIGAVTVKKMADEFGCNMKNIIAGIGPCIGKCCYEVDDPVYNEFKNAGFSELENLFFKKENGRYMLDLAEANRRILIEAGIDPEKIDVTDICTCCNHNDLHSHRATGGKRGNLALIVELI